MEFEQVMQYLKEKYGNLPCYSQIVEYAQSAFGKWEHFKLDEKEDGIRISSVIEEIENGDFGLLQIQENRENGEMSVISIKKQYGPQMEIRNGFREEVGFNMFSDQSTAVFDKDGLQLGGTWYSDENKYYDMPDKSVESLVKAFKDTSPQYGDRGEIVKGPTSSYRPFTNSWERIGKTRVIHRHGRSPMDGEYSEVGVRFVNQDGKEETVYFLKENHGKVYAERRGWFGTLAEVAKKVESLIDKNIETDPWGKTTLDIEGILGELSREASLDK